MDVGRHRPRVFRSLVQQPGGRHARDLPQYMQERLRTGVDFDGAAVVWQRSGEIAVVQRDISEEITEAANAPLESDLREGAARAVDVRLYPCAPPVFQRDRGE